MHKIEKKTSGYVLTFGGNITAEEMQQWVNESRNALESQQEAFSVIVDMRNLAPLTSDAQRAMVEGQQLYKQKGMTRSAVIVNNAVTAIQFKRLAQQSGIYKWERYIDGSQPGFSETALAWVKQGVDPDAKN
jgi:anti-anti-sigma regulatory factor